MNSNVEMISKEMIKPSSQTPDHLKIFELSLFDQFTTPVYVPIIFFYESDESRGLVTSNHVRISQTLKESLSETLNLFYPLAGRVRDDGSAVDCNDAGAEFVEARVHSRLAELTGAPDAEQLKKLLPVVLMNLSGRSGGALLHVQLNSFDCGGIGIGICVSHLIADAASIMKFVTAWASTPTRDCQISPLHVQLSRYFPVKESPGSNNLWETLTAPEPNLVAKRLVFTKENLAALKQSVVSSTRSTVEDPTRVELVSAFVWRHISEFFKNHPERGPFAASHAINLRSRVGQSYKFLENVFGNFVAAAFVFPGGDGVEEFHETVKRFRTAIRSINVDNFAGSSEVLGHSIREIFKLFTNGKVKEWYPFTSWCRFPIYEVDFEWGKPVLVSAPTWALKNAIVLMDGKNGEDIHVWVYMDPEIAQILETESKLI